MGSVCEIKWKKRNKKNFVHCLRKQQPHLSVSVLGRWTETHWQNWRPGDGFCWVVFPAHYFPSNMFAVICAVQSGAQTRTERQTWRLRTETWDGLWSGQSRTGSVISLWGLGWVSVVGLLCLVISWSVCGWMLVEVCVCVCPLFLGQSSAAWTHSSALLVPVHFSVGSIPPINRLSFTRSRRFSSYRFMTRCDFHLKRRRSLPKENIWIYGRLWFDGRLRSRLQARHNISSLLAISTFE